MKLFQLALILTCVQFNLNAQNNAEFFPDTTNNPNDTLLLLGCMNLLLSVNSDQGELQNEDMGLFSFSSDNESDTLSISVGNPIKVDFDIQNETTAQFVHVEVISEYSPTPCFTRKIPVSMLKSYGFCIGGHVSIGLVPCSPGANEVYITIERNNELLGPTISQTINL